MHTPPEDTPVDRSRRFVPEHLTPLFFSPVYASLGEAQRLRYNQLHALYFNEQIAFFEQAMARHILGALLQRPEHAPLRKVLETFLDEEMRHTAMFRALNRRCAPEFYGSADHYFIRPPPGSLTLLRWLASHPWHFPFFIWIMLVQEERAMYYAKQFLRSAEPLEPHFVAVQRRHLADEVDHVRWDEELLQRLWVPATRRKRRVNARLFAWMMGEFFLGPRRAGLNVVRQLVREFPDSIPAFPELRRELRALDHNPEFQLALYARSIVPRSFAHFDRWPEFATLGRVFHGYRTLTEAP
jgi:hypothetical protein